MGKSVGVGSSSQNQVRMKGVLGKHLGQYLDQYTFICVFGSVVGYAVMPLIGTMETLVLSVIVIGLSIHGLRKSSHKEDDRGRRSKDDRKSRKQDSKKSLHVQVIADSESQNRRQRESQRDVKVEDEEAEQLRRLEEKREKKARKKEERNRRKEVEKKEKEREEQARKGRQEARALRKQVEREAKEKARGFLLPTYESIQAMVSTPPRPVRRERKASTSSTSSGSSSTHSPRTHSQTPPRPHPLPMRAASDPLLYPSLKPVPWSSNKARSANNTFPRLPVSNNIPPWPAAVDVHQTITSNTPPHSYSWQQELTPSPPHYASTAAQNTWSYQTTPVFPALGALNSVETLTPQQVWNPERPAPVANGTSMLPDLNVWHGNKQQNGGFSPILSPNGRFYSLFSNEVASPFVDFQAPPTNMESDHVTSNTANRLDVSSTGTNENGKSNKMGFDEWPNI